MALQFFTAVIDPSRAGHYFQTHSEIAKVYLRGWFWIDLSSVVPTDMFFFKEGVRFSKALKVLRLVRLLRLARIQRITNRWHTYFGFSYAAIALLKFGVWIAIVCHWSSLCSLHSVTLTGSLTHALVSHSRSHTYRHSIMYQIPCDPKWCENTRFHRFTQKIPK